MAGVRLIRPVAGRDKRSRAALGKRRRLIIPLPSRYKSDSENPRRTASSRLSKVPLLRRLRRMWPAAGPRLQLDRQGEVLTSVTTAKPQEQRDAEVDMYMPHLLYEIQELAEMPAWVAKFDTEGPAVLKVATLESCLVHARLIIEFLMGRPKSNGNGRQNRHPGDIRPSMFTDSWHPTHPTMFDAYLNRLDKHLVHLTTERGTVTVDDGSWAMNEVSKILRAMEAFALVLTTEGSRHGPTIDSACNRGLSLQPVPPSDAITASTTTPPEATIITGV